MPIAREMSPAPETRRPFDECGFLGPQRLFDAAECQRIVRALRERPLPAPADWDKGLAVSSALIHELAADPRILDLVSGLIGDDILLWGASIRARRPGRPHPWHTDIETSAAEGTAVSVWIGLEHTGRESSLTIVPGSHRYGKPLQQVAGEEGRRRGEVTDEDVARWARARHAGASVQRLDMLDGDVVVFDGRLWHGAFNQTALVRTALLLQYATPATRIRMPDLTRLDWPFPMREDVLPPCLVMRGRADGSPNRIVAAPVREKPPRALEGTVRPLRLPLEDDPVTGWKVHRQFRGATPNLAALNCHVSVLGADRTPHEPHEHAEEELLIMLAGSAELVIPDASGSGAVRTQLLERGAFAFYPAGQLHTLRTTGGPATYLMFKWKGHSVAPGPLPPVSLVDAAGHEPAAGSAGTNGFRTRGLLERPTAALRRLHAHASSVEPGGGYASHVDDHDVALLVLDGVIETLDQRVEEHGIVFIPAGVPHGMHNPGRSPARYLVFEFHGRQATEPPPREARPAVTRLTRAAPADDRYDLVWFWKQNDSGLYGRRQDMLVRELLRSPRVRRIVHFDRPVTPRELLGDVRLVRHPLARHEHRVLLQTLPRLLPWPLGRKLTRHTFLNSGKPPEGWLARALPAPDTYADYVGRILRRAGVGSARTVFWVCPRNPSFPRLVRLLQPALVVADCIDDHRAWPDATPQFIERATTDYRETLRLCDVVLANSAGMADALSEFRRDVHVLESGVDAPSARVPCPAELRVLPRPILGYAGNLSARIDVELLRRLALRHPEWSLVLIGSSRPGDAIHALAALPNVTLLGVRPYDRVRACVQHFDVALLPHTDDALTRTMSPLKLGVYCAEGVPVVATRVAHLGPCEPLVEVASDAEDFIARVERVLRPGAPRATDSERAAILHEASWERRAAAALALLDEAWTGRGLSARP